MGTAAAAAYPGTSVAVRDSMCGAAAGLGAHDGAIGRARFAVGGCA
jgi:hypothetical protein